jgi:hypothetical protein
MNRWLKPNGNEMDVFVSKKRFYFIAVPFMGRTAVRNTGALPKMLKAISLFRDSEISFFQFS